MTSLMAFATARAISSLYRSSAIFRAFLSNSSSWGKVQPESIIGVFHVGGGSIKHDWKPWEELDKLQNTLIQLHCSNFCKMKILSSPQQDG
jgi:hypothetical protein